MSLEKDFEVRIYSAHRKDSGRVPKAVKALVFKNRILTAGAGYGPLLRDYVYFLLAKLAFHRQHPEFNGLDSLQSARRAIAQEPHRTF